MAELHCFSSESELQKSVCSLIATKSKNAIEDHGFFTVAFSGGSSAKIICNGLQSKGKDLGVDFSKWRILFCDERYVKLTDPDSNYKIVKDNLLDKIPTTVKRPVDETSPVYVVALNPALPLEEAAKDYENRLRELLPSVTAVPCLDMLLLGMGPDGHICSLFPGHKLLGETDKLVAPISDSPKPPPSRITLTFPVINNASCAVYVATGISKAEVVKRVIEGNEKDPLPAARVKLVNGEVHWFLDEGSASLLSRQRAAVESSETQVVQ